MAKILYLNLMMCPKKGEIFREGVMEGVRKSEWGPELEFISLDLFSTGKEAVGLRQLADRVRGISPDALIISGSEKNVSDGEDRWVEEFLKALRDILEVPAHMEDWMGPAFPVFGICFGHQALARALGGEVSRFRFQLGAVQLRILAQARRHPVLEKLLVGQSEIPAMVTHGDQVIRMPKGFHLLFTSDYCEVQGMAHDRFPIFSLQSHPEITGRMRDDTDPEEKNYWNSLDANELNSHPGSKILMQFTNWALKRATFTQ